MRLNTRAILPALFAAILMLLAFQPASTAQDIQATPITDPEPNVTNTSQLNPLAEGEPTVTYSHSESIEGLFATTDFYFTTSYDFTGYDFGIPAENVTIVMYLDAGGATYTPRSVSQYGVTATQTYQNDNLFRANLAEACRTGEGFITAEFGVYAYESINPDNLLYDHEGLTVQIPCTVNVTPVAPSEPVEVCGPGNNSITIPDQPPGVIVEDTEWIGTSRTITYSPAEWAFFPSTFKPVFTYTDTGDCAITSSLNPPQLSAVCGENNDAIIPAWSQADGIDVVPIVSDWSIGMATLTYSALDGYYFPDGIDNEIVVTDSGTGECLTDLSISVEEGAFVNVSVGDTVDVTVTATVPEGYTMDIPHGSFYADQYKYDDSEGFGFLFGYAETESLTFEYPLTNDVKNSVCDDGFITLTPSLTRREDGFEFLGNPVTYPCSFQEVLPSVSLVYPDSIYELPDANYYFSAHWNMSDVDFESTYGVPSSNVSFTANIALTGSTGSVGTTRSLSEYGNVNEIPFVPTGSFSEQLALNCVTNNGRIKGDMSFTAFNNQTAETFYEATPQTFDIPCSVNLSPDTPVVTTDVCGPGNDAITIPTLPYGLAVNDTDWGNNTRTITFPTETWIVYPDGFETSYPFTDTEDCDASVTFSHPDSMYLIQQDTQVPVGAEYDISAIWSEDDPTSIRIWGRFSGTQFAGGSAIDNPVGSFDHTSTFQPGVVADLCIRGNGELELTVVVEFSHPSGEDWIIFWSAEETRTVPCSVAVTPAQATVNNDVCGYIDDRINVPSQQGIVGYDITWNGNVATITYEAIAPYEVVGGPFTVEVTADPCVTEPVPDPEHIELCGIENDDVTLGADVEGVRYSSSDGWVDGVYSIRVSALPGWELPEGTETTWEIVDPGNCEIEGLTAPIHTEVCGENNDTVDLPAEQDHLTITTNGDMATGGPVTVTLTPDEHYNLPAEIQAEYTFSDAGDCIVTPIPPEAPVGVCGPNNDILTIPLQPEGVIIEDSNWVENERTLTLRPAEGYVFPENTPRTLTSIDQNIECEVDPETTTLLVTFETSDGGSVEGESYSFHAPAASQTLQEPFVEGEIGPGNQVVIEDLIAGTYRLVANPEGYEPIDETIEINATSASEEHSIAVSALQPAETPTPEPTIEPTTEPTTVPTIEATPTQSPADPTPVPTDDSAPVTGLPSTGSGSGTGFGFLALAGLLAAMSLAVIDNRRRSNA